MQFTKTKTIAITSFLPLYLLIGIVITSFLNSDNFSFDLSLMKWGEFITYELIVFWPLMFLIKFIYLFAS